MLCNARKRTQDTYREREGACPGVSGMAAKCGKVLCYFLGKRRYINDSIYQYLSVSIYLKDKSNAVTVSI